MTEVRRRQLESAGFVREIPGQDPPCAPAPRDHPRPSHFVEYRVQAPVRVAIPIEVISEFEKLRISVVRDIDPSPGLARLRRPKKTAADYKTVLEFSRRRRVCRVPTCGQITEYVKDRGYPMFCFVHQPPEDTL